MLLRNEKHELKDSDDIRKLEQKADNALVANLPSIEFIDSARRVNNDGHAELIILTKKVAKVRATFTIDLVQEKIKYGE